MAPSTDLANCNASTRPVVSVVTVVRNAAEALEGTIHSVLGQDYPASEYLIIDGASTDSTLDVIRRHEAGIQRWISEPDLGIYDAMNKGTALATGDWILFMNAGDSFHSPDALSKLDILLSGDADVILAGAEKVLVDAYETRRFTCPPGPVSELWREMPACHQAVLVRRALQQEFGFDTSFRWCADHHLLARLHQAGKSFASTESLLCTFDCAGGTARDPMIFIRERWRISKPLAPPFKRALDFASEWIHCRLWGPVVRLLRSLIPQAAILKLRRFRGTEGL